MKANPLMLALVAAYAGMSVLTGIMYGWDKLCAKRGWSRVPEMRLHLMEFLCGWPGAWVAQRVFRHKSQKASFRRGFALAVVLNVVVVGGLVYWMVGRDGV